MYFVNQFPFSRLSDQHVKMALDSIDWNIIKNHRDWKDGVTKWFGVCDILSDWLKSHILDATWGVQVLCENMNIHADSHTSARIMYPLIHGGHSVKTTFYEDDQATVIESVILDTHTWYMVKSDVYHDVQGVDTGCFRVILTCRIHPQYPPFHLSNRLL